jgi:hypothetical protein
MDAGHFDRLTRALSQGTTRRRLTALLGGLGLGSLVSSPWQQRIQAKKKKPCPPCKKRKKGKCKGTLADGTACSGGTCQGGRCLPACTDTIQNGTESDVDCGGSCGRCPNTKRCTSRSDCASAFCASGTCQACPENTICGMEGVQSCACTSTATNQLVCINASRFGGNCQPDFSCPTDYVCINSFGGPACVGLCAAP